MTSPTSPRQTRIFWKRLSGKEQKQGAGNLDKGSKKFDLNASIFNQSFSFVLSSKYNFHKKNFLFFICTLIPRKGLGGGESPEHEGPDFQLDTDMSPKYELFLTLPMITSSFMCNQIGIRMHMFDMLMFQSCEK